MSEINEMKKNFKEKSKKKKFELRSALFKKKKKFNPRSQSLGKKEYIKNLDNLKFDNLIKEGLKGLSKKNQDKGKNLEKNEIELIVNKKENTQFLDIKPQKSKFRKSISMDLNFLENEVWKNENSSPISSQESNSNPSSNSSIQSSNEFSIPIFDQNNKLKERKNKESKKISEGIINNKKSLLKDSKKSFGEETPNSKLKKSAKFSLIKIDESNRKIIRNIPRNNTIKNSFTINYRDHFEQNSNRISNRYRRNNTFRRGKL